LPVDFRALPAAIRRALRLRPLALLLIGEAQGERAVRVERVALNLVDARIPDNRGRQPVDQAVVRGGPLARPATLDPKWVRGVLARTVPVRLSTSAGTYACNAAFYLAATQARGTQVVFIHVPSSRRVLGAKRAGAALARLIRKLDVVLQKNQISRA
jgi:pyroglutamyl-peptidase